MQKVANLSNINLSEEDAVAGMSNRIRLTKAEQTKNDSRWADKMRSLVQVHEYLCHIGEAIEWIESFLGEKIDDNDNKEASIVHLEKTLHDGVVLAKLAQKIHPGIISSIISGDAKFKFLRSNNINAFLQVLKEVGLPSIFWFEFVDLYDGKNMPKNEYSHLLHSTQVAPAIKNLHGEFNFSEDILVATQRSLEKSGATMPNFNNLGSSLQKELDGKNNKKYAFRPIEEPILLDDPITMIPALRNRNSIGNSKNPTPDLIAYDSDTESKLSDADEDDDSVDYHQHPMTLQTLRFLDATNDSSISSSESDLDEYHHGSLSSDEESSDGDGIRERTLERHFSKPENHNLLVTAQGCIRAYMAKAKMQKIKDQHYYQSYHSQAQQGKINTFWINQKLGEKRMQYFASPENWVISLQAMIRRHLAMNKLRHQIRDGSQRFNYARQQGLASAQLHENTLQQLKSEKNPPIGVVKSVLHMLSNNDVDFHEDLVIEELRQKVIESIRENNQLDSQVSMIDVQIALLLKNVVTLDEVVKLSNAFFHRNRKMQQQRKFSELVSGNSQNHDLRSVDKTSREKLELYQQLVYLLQTEPMYLARLMSVAGGHSERKGQRKLDATVLALFGYGTNAREECLLINLCKACIVQEIKHVQNIQEFMRGNYTFMKLVVQVNRGAKERAFFSSLFSPLVKKVINNRDLDLETNPMVIYQKCINQEELATGQPSSRPFNVNQSEALQSPDVVQILSEHVESLRLMTDEFLDAIIQTVNSVPYGMRAIARELRIVMEEAFPDEHPEEIIKTLGNFIYYRYLSPAITAPEQYDVINCDVSPIQRRNLAEISKMLQQISSGKSFDSRNTHLSALNDYIKEASQKLSQWFVELTDVEEPEDHFGMDPLADHTSTQKPTVYIHPTELYHIHQLLEEHADYVEHQKSGILHAILQDLGEAPTDVNLTVPLRLLRLELVDRRDGLPDDTNGGGDVKKLLLDTKRLIILVIQVQSGPTLEAILNEPVTEEHERIWEIVREEQFPSTGTDKEIEMANRERNFKFGYKNASMDVKSLSFAKLKSFATKLHAYLMQHGVIAESPGYQSIINMIAMDITKKGERRKLRNAEIKKLQNILAHLEEKRNFLIGQGESYKEYLDSCMKNMAEKRGKKQKFVFPFTRQYFHIKNLQKRGLVPKFGSFKYSAKTLYDRGIIVDLAGVSPKLYSRITIILSMDRAGIITFEGYFPLLNTQDLHVDVHYEDLLQTQYEGVQTIKVLDGMATVNVNLLIYLINKKFYHTA
ncbi:hypothetical protein G6F70_004765 [Rhizopus microsporus]|nr:hypothetical protein G6F71_004853 [Rhizopus microsporus]KAG1199624.1 hypothetical protein G6F70_004765 [Rhizopus microsporus]KAG1215913.1 hypothetical protein G6F69_000547 [Rhizopus microsporus]